MFRKIVLRDHGHKKEQVTASYAYYLSVKNVLTSFGNTGFYLLGCCAILRVLSFELIDCVVQLVSNTARDWIVASDHDLLRF